MSKYTFREHIIYHWRHSKLVLIILLIPVIALYFLKEGIISIGEYIDIILIAFLVAVTYRYARLTFNLVEINRKLLRETKKETIIRDLRMKLKNLYTPLNIRYFVDNVVSNREKIFFNHLKTKDYKEYYMDRPEKESFEKLIGDNLHFADDDLEKGLNEIRYSTNDFTIPRERCNEIADLIKTGYEKYKKEYEELVSPKIL